MDKNVELTGSNSFQKEKPSSSCFRMVDNKGENLSDQKETLLEKFNREELNKEFRKKIKK